MYPSLPLNFSGTAAMSKQRVALSLQVGNLAVSLRPLLVEESGTSRVSG